MRIAVLGAGSLGSLFAGLLARHDDVLLVGRDDAHLEAIRNDGLTVVEPDGSTVQTHPAVTTEHDAVAGADLLLLAVKSYDTETAMESVAAGLDGTTVLTLQNGLGNVASIADVVPRESIVAGTTTHGAHLRAPGRVAHTGFGETKIGSVSADGHHHVRPVAAAFERNNVAVTVIDDVAQAIWEKVLVNVGINAATALARVPNGRLVTEPAGERLLEQSVTEAAAVATAVGHPPPEDIVAVTRNVATETAANRSSMLQDIEAGKRTEVDALTGAVVELADEYDIEVPINRTLRDCIHLAESGCYGDDGSPAKNDSG